MVTSTNAQSAAFRRKKNADAAINWYANVVFTIYITVADTCSTTLRASIVDMQKTRTDPAEQGKQSKNMNQINV